jgi:hypothetical protein
LHQACITTDATGLSRFLEEEVLPWFDMHRKELANRPLIREQAFGEALNVHKLEGLDERFREIGGQGTGCLLRDSSFAKS